MKNKDATHRTIQNVAVLGAGSIGSDIAYSCLEAGYAVVMVDASDRAIEKCIERLQNILASEQRRGHLSESQVNERLTHISGLRNISSLTDVDLVIETVHESMVIKKLIFKELDAYCKSGAILTACTSSLDIDQIALTTTRAADLAGLHFIGPETGSRIVEIIKGIHTSENALLICQEFFRSLGKVGVVVGNSFGFVGSRMLYCYAREIQMLIQGGTLPEQIDKALSDWGMGGGFFSTTDMADINRGMIAYSKSASIPRAADPEESASNGISRAKRRTDSSREIIRRCIYTLINEGAYLLEEDVAMFPADIDLIWVNGYGFPPDRGGPMMYADSIGLDVVYSEICRFRDAYSSIRWQPAPLLERLALSGKKFADVAAWV